MTISIRRFLHKESALPAYRSELTTEADRPAAETRSPAALTRRPPPSARVECLLAGVHDAVCALVRRRTPRGVETAHAVLVRKRHVGDIGALAAPHLRIDLRKQQRSSLRSSTRWPRARGART